MNPVIFWYLGLFLICCSIGMNKVSSEKREIYLRFVIPIIMVEPMIAQRFHIGILPQTLLFSVLVNGLEFGGFATGWKLGDFLRRI